MPFCSLTGLGAQWAAIIETTDCHCLIEEGFLNISTFTILHTAISDRVPPVEKTTIGICSNKKLPALCYSQLKKLW